MDKQTVKDIRNIMIGVAACDAVMAIVFMALGKLTPGVFYGILLTLVFTFITYLHLARSINKATAMTEGGQAFLQRSYTVRLLLQAACAVIAAKAPFIDVYAGIIPLFFPRIALYIMGFLENRKQQKGE